MLKKPKRNERIDKQENKTPQTIIDLIRRYDLDNTKIYDFLDELVVELNSLHKENIEKLSCKIDKGIILYDNSEGFYFGSVNIDDYSSYDRVEVYGGNDENEYSFLGSGRTNQNFLKCGLISAGAETLYIFGMRLTVLGNVLTVYSNYRCYFLNGETWGKDEAKITIRRIVGYKEEI